VGPRQALAGSRRSTETARTRTDRADTCTSTRCPDSATRRRGWTELCSRSVGVPAGPHHANRAGCCPLPFDLSHGQAADLRWLSLGGRALDGRGRWSATESEPFRRGAAAGASRRGAVLPEAARGEPHDIGVYRDLDGGAGGAVVWPAAEHAGQGLFPGAGGELAQALPLARCPVTTKIPHPMLLTSGEESSLTIRDGNGTRFVGFFGGEGPFVTMKITRSGALPAPLAGSQAARTCESAAGRP
jgi:hypothetical protein